MSEKQEKSVSRFIRGECAARNVTRFILRHVSGKGKGTEIESFDIVEALESEGDADRFASLVYQRAQMDADGYGTATQRYMLFSVHKQGEEEKLGSRVTFRCKGDVDLDIDEDDGGDEPATNRGLLAQLMRHNENNNRTLVGSTQALMTGMARQVDAVMKQNERLLDERSKMLAMIEESLTEKHLREMQALQETKKQERIDFGLKKAALLAPVALDYLTGGKMGAPSSSQVMMKELASTLTPEQLQALQGIMSPEQLITLFRLIESANNATQSKKEEEEKTNGSQVS